MKIGLKTTLEEYDHIAECMIDSSNGRRAKLPFSKFDYADFRNLRELADLLSLSMRRDCVASSWAINYTKQEVIFVWEKTMDHVFTVEIPYGSRSEHFDFILDTNHMLGDCGRSVLFVCNDPYHLEAVLCIEVWENDSIGRRVALLLEQQGLRKNTGYGIAELLAEVGERRWNVAALSQGENDKQILESLFLFAEIEELQRKGFSGTRYFKPRIFVSYCHADKKIVHQVIESLKIGGLHFWLDIEELDIGDIILERVANAISECDLHLVFISQHTAAAHFASYELKSIWRNFIYQSAKMFLVRLDDVEPDDIVPTLGQYLYFDFREGSEVADLQKAIRKKIDKHKVF